jgi:tetratricopeptide (TPR) repeat protein
MEVSNYYVGYLVRKTRQELGIHLKELSEIAHSSTLSKFERGLCALSTDKLEHLYSILHIQKKDVPHLLKRLIREQTAQDLAFHGIESMINQNIYPLVQFKDATNYLHSQTALNYLKAKYFLQKKKFTEATPYYHEVIHSKENDYTYLHLNIISSTYLDLSLIAHRENKFKLALEYAELGKNAFCPKGKRKYVIDSLIFYKSLFLQEMGKLEEAEQTLEEVWNKRLSIENVSTKVKVYRLKALLQKYQDNYDEAGAILEKAIEIAISNSLIDTSFELWVELGDIAYARNLYDLSEKAYQAALLSKNNLKSKKIVTEAHISLARLYAKIGLLKKAKTEIQRAITNAEEYKDISKLTRSLFLQGKILANTDLEHAIIAFGKAWELSKAYELNELEYKILSHLIKHEKNKDTQQELMLRKLKIKLRVEEE